MNKTELFYTQYSKKDRERIEHDINSSVRKAIKIKSALSVIKGHSIGCVIDYGCGFGSTVRYLAENMQILSAYGFEYSMDALNSAKECSNKAGVEFHKLPSLDAAENSKFIKTIVNMKVDYIMLNDVLEHVPDCVSLIRHLSQISNNFIIKLPMEKSFFDNILIGKEYPGINQCNGHLREFDANDVHYFIRKLGLTPLFEEVYVYMIDDAFPRYNRYSWKTRIVKNFKRLMSLILPKKIFLNLIGGGSYLCIAVFDESLILNP